MTNILASAPHQAVRRRAPVEQVSPGATALRPCETPSSPGAEQTRFRWDLKRISEANPHLIDDIGLTRRQVEEEIAKLPFWQR